MQQLKRMVKSDPVSGGSSKSNLAIRGSSKMGPMTRGIVAIESNDSDLIVIDSR